MSAMFEVYGLTATDGSLSCRALNSLTADALAIEGSQFGKMHIMGVGKWDGHPRGSFQVTLDDLKQIIRNFDEQKNPMVVDYDHSAPDKGDTKAAGWIHALSLRGNQLWADVEWTPKAVQAIKDGEYKFNSPWWALNSKHRVTGEPTGPILKNVALTNMPFFDGQEALKLSALTCEANPMEEILAAIAKSAGLSPEAVLEKLPAMADQIGALMRDMQAQATPPVAEEKPNAELEIEVPVEESKASTISASEAAQIAAQAQTNSLLASIVARLNALEAKDEETKKASEIAAQQARVERVDQMIRCGQLLPTEKDDACKLLAFDAALFENTYKDRKPTVPIGVKQAGHEDKRNGGDEITFTASELYTLKSLQGAGYTKEKAKERVISLRKS